MIRAPGAREGRGPGRLPGAVLVLFSLLVSSLAAAPAAALETDQYLVWGLELADSREPVNRYLNRRIERRLAELGPRAASRFACEDLPPRLFRDLFPSLLYSPWRRFLGRSPEIARHPEREVGYFEHLGDSVYSRPSFPFILPLGRTIRIGEVYVGTDKLAGHMFGFGRRYYKRYLADRRRGLEPEAAVRRAVEWGLTVERFFVGGLVDGVFSPGDLEANYQGLRLARDLCEAEPPHLERVGGRWRLSRPVDLAEYVSPLLDESYNRSHYVGHRWRQVRPELVEKVCPEWRSPRVARRLGRYRNLEQPSPSRRAVDEFFARRKPDPRVAQRLETICGSTPRNPARQSATTAN